MEYAPIGDTGLRASRIALGTWSIGGLEWGGTDDGDALATLARAFDLGINCVDTAPIYGCGHSEELLGRAIREYGHRERIIVATKFGLDWRGPEVIRNSSPQRVREELHDSLRRLGTDYIDIYQVHWPDESVPLERTASLLAEFIQQGKVRAVGVSNFSDKQIESFQRGGPLHTVQPPYNLFERAAEHNVLPYCRRNRIAVFAYSPLCRGLLSGRVTPQTKFASDDVRRSDPKFQPPRFVQYLQAVRRLDEFARNNFGKSIVHLAIRWLLDQKVDVVLLGARRPAHLDTVQDCFGWELGPGAMVEIGRILDESITDPVGAEFLAPPEKVVS